MGSKKRKKKQVKRQEYMKRKQEQNIPFQKSSPYDRKVFRYICMFLYVIFCVFLCGMVKSLGITPNVIEGIFGVMLVMVEGILFFILFDKVWPSHESKKIEKKQKSSSNSSSSSGFGDYSSNDCSAQVMVEEIAEVVETKLVFQKND